MLVNDIHEKHLHRNG